MRMQIAMIPTRNLLAHMEVAFVAGLVDVPGPWVEALDDHVADLLVTMDGDIPSAIAPVRLLHIAQAVPANVVRELAHSDVDRFVTSRFSRTIPSQRSNAQVLFRLTDLQSGHGGGGVLAFAGTLCVDDVRTLDADNIHELSTEDDDALRWDGRIGRELRRHHGEPSIASNMNGARLGSAFDLAVWGFGHEPMALGSTLPLAFVRLCERYQDLFFADQRSSADEMELTELRELVVSTGMAPLDRVPEMAEGLSRFRQSPDYVPPFAPRSRAQQAELLLHFARSMEAPPPASRCQ
jgi:hypothetical protein